MTDTTNGGRTHEPSLRELTAQLDDLKELVDIKDTATRELMHERDRRYEDRFKGQETAVAAALAAQKELTTSAFASSEKAIGKAETAQSDYNVRSNEFRGQLDDQAKMLMPRTETENTFKQHRELIDRLRDEGRIAVEAGTRESRLLVESVRAEIVTLQKSEVQAQGRKELSTPLLMLIAAIVAGLVVFLIEQAMKR